MAEISKIKCNVTGEAHTIKDAKARQDIATLQTNVTTMQTAIENITGGGIDSYVTETELASKGYVTQTELNNLKLVNEDFVAEQVGAVDEELTTLKNDYNTHKNNTSGYENMITGNTSRIEALENKTLSASVSDEILTITW